MGDYLRELAGYFKKKPIYVSGIQQDKLCDSLPKSIRKFETVTAFMKQILS
jgi:hypothetical protein